MTEHEKKLLQAKHRLEEAQARDRVKERKPEHVGSSRKGRFSFFPKGVLTHHPEGAVVFPAEIVRFPRGIAASADAAGQGCISVKLPALSMQSARGTIL